MEEIRKSIFCTIVMRRTIYGIVRNVHTQQMLINGSIRYIKCPKKYNFRMNPYFSCPELRVKV